MQFALIVKFVLGLRFFELEVGLFQVPNNFRIFGLEQIKFLSLAIKRCLQIRQLCPETDHNFSNSNRLAFSLLLNTLQARFLTRNLIRHLQILVFQNRALTNERIQIVKF